MKRRGKKERGEFNEDDVDGEGQIRIGKTLIDGLSEGEQLQLTFRVAKAQAGELKLSV